MAAAVVSKDYKGNAGEDAGRWLGTCAIAADAERAAIGLACEVRGSMAFILTDS